MTCTAFGHGVIVSSSKIDILDSVDAGVIDGIDAHDGVGV